MENKPQIKKKKKKKINAVSVWATIVSMIAVFALIGIVAGLAIIINMLKDKPTLNIKDFDSQESSVVYDMNGKEIANLGLTIRENIGYDQLPNIVVDAFIAVEDSRFFEHNGFDVPRFAKAMIENIKSLSFSQGGSTFTMQLCKNTYFTSDETGTEASRSGLSGIKRKVQEIALAMELEQVKSKKSILTDYINKINFGGEGNIRGIQKAANYYFKKDVEELNISEAALLVGIINAPTYYNPFNNLEASTDRRNEVLYLMNYHGYISDTEYEIAKSIKVEDLLADPNAGDGEGTPYQAYVDAVVDEVLSLTGLSPYSTTMHIYTYMDPEIQSLMDEIQKGNVDDYFTYPDEWYEVASICVDNDTGEIIGILGGRNYSRGGALLLNHAIDQYKQPGSSIKPIIDYSLAFENLGWSTSHVLTDKPIFYGYEDIVVRNFSKGYVGDVTLSTAIGESINTVAIQTLQQVIAAKGKSGAEYVVDYMKSIGFDVDLETFDIQFAIGGAELTVSVEQMASAYAMIMNGGRYIEPHTVARIEFTDGKSPVTPTYESTQVLSEAAAYLTATMLKSNVNNYGGSYSFVRDKNYQVYAKTGTTDWSTSGVDYGIPIGANKDAWVVTCTSDYSVATWTGYEKASSEHISYITDDVYYQRIQARIADLILDKTYDVYGKPEEIKKPEGVSSITHIIGTYPYATVIEGMDEKYITSGLVKTGTAKLVSPTPASVEPLDTSDEKTYMLASSTDDTITLNWAKYPDEEKLKIAEEEYEYKLTKGGEVVATANLRRLFDYSWIYGPVQYKAEITIKHIDNSETVLTVASDKEKKTIEDITIVPGDTVSAVMYYGYEKTGVNSNSVTRTVAMSTSIDAASESTYASTDAIRTWASSNGITLNIEYDYPNASNPANSIRLIAADTPEWSSSSGTHFTGNAGVNYTCYYYAKSLSVDGSASGTVDVELTLSATKTNISNSLVWSCSDPSVTLTSSDTTCTFLTSTPGTYTVTVKESTADDAYAQTITVEIS